MEVKVLQVGAIVKYNSIRLQVVSEVQRCRGCYFSRLTKCMPVSYCACQTPFRDANVIFRKVDARKLENKHSYKSVTK